MIVAVIRVTFVMLASRRMKAHAGATTIRRLALAAGAALLAAGCSSPSHLGGMPGEWNASIKPIRASGEPDSERADVFHEFHVLRRDRNGKLRRDEPLELGL